MFWRRFRKALVQVPGQVQEGSGKCSGEGSCSTRFQRRFWKALVESQARFNDFPEKVAENFRKVLARSNKVPEGSGEGFGRCWRKAGPGSARFRKVPEKVSEKVPERLGAEVGQVQVGSGAIRGVCWRNFEVNFQPISDEQFCENKLLLLLGIPPKLISAHVSKVLRLP